MLEVVAELLVPFVIASLIDKGIEAGNLRNVYLYGALMIVLAFFGLVFGILAGRFAASASSGFAYNLRQSMEIWCECFGKDRSNLRRSDSNEIIGILKRIGWQRAESKVRIPLYGPQYIFVPKGCSE